MYAENPGTRYALHLVSPVLEFDYISVGNNQVARAPAGSIADGVGVGGSDERGAYPFLRLAGRHVFRVFVLVEG
jgi:hypothetical protein